MATPTYGMNKDTMEALLQVASSIDGVASTYRASVSQAQLFHGLLRNAQNSLRAHEKTFKKGHPELTKDTTLINVFHNLYATQLEYVQYLKAHSAAFRDGLKRRWDPEGLEKYVETDSGIYMEQTTLYNSQIFGVMKSVAPDIMILTTRSTRQSSPIHNWPRGWQPGARKGKGVTNLTLALTSSVRRPSECRYVQCATPNLRC
jgi:hypothetical protein